MPESPAASILVFNSTAGPTDADVAMTHASLILSRLTDDNDGQRDGIEIVRRAVQTKRRQISGNPGEDGSLIAGKPLETNGYSRGTRQVGPFF